MNEFYNWLKDVDGKSKSTCNGYTIAIKKVLNEESIDIDELKLQILKLIPIYSKVEQKSNWVVKDIIP
ncbi:MAG: hypothetical protein FWF56_04425 [Firmicutes bacterium]|nr:hypothetical protein [Bacillota bacterium]